MPRGFRHGRKAGRCGDPLRNVSTENPLDTTALTWYMIKKMGTAEEIGLTYAEAVGVYVETGF